jgi:fructose-specific phosphotransferase system IIA component
MINIFQENTILADLQATTREQVIDEMIQLLNQAGVLSDAAAYKKAIYAREKLSSTGIGFGIAIPHAKCSAVSEARVAVGISRQGIDYGDEENEKVRLVFMIAVGDADDDLHLRTLASLSRRLIDPVFRNHLSACCNSSEILHILHDI